MREKIIYKLKQNRYFLTALLIALSLLEYSYYGMMSFGYEGAGNVLTLFLFTMASGLYGFLGIVFPMVAALPYATTYVREYKSGYLRCERIRKGQAHYIVGKLVASFFYGGFALAIPVGVYAIQLSLTRENTAPLLDENGNSFVSYLRDFALASPKGYMAMSVGIVFLCGAVFSVLALGISTWIKNEFLTIVLPFAMCILVAILSPVGWFNFLLLFCPSEYGLVQTWQLVVMGVALLMVGVLLFVFGVKCNEKE
ncbi:MAG: hypothetical protein PUA77_02830 [Lachnospiraceae bacterium]|nr:hypothetical protein [Lachnospiraceae bacterium]